MLESSSLMMKMMKKLSNEPLERRALQIEEVRLVSDLRIMHAKVDELFQIVSNLKRRHREGDIHRYADQPVLNEDIEHVDDIYLWFVSLKDELRRQHVISRKK